MKLLAARALLLGAVVALVVPVVQTFAAPAARPGGAFDVEHWPAELPPSAPRDVATLQIPQP